MPSRQNSKRYSPFPFHSVRHISCPEDLENDRKVYVGHAPLYSILDLPTDENVRDYLVDAEGKKRKILTSVHRAIQDTLENASHNFSVLNGGLTIVARDCEIDEKEKCLSLLKPSIINGSQTQGVVRSVAASVDGELRDSLLRNHVKFEVIVTTNEDLIAEISISRNFQNDVMPVSIVGRLGQLDELEKAFQRHIPNRKLRKSETDLTDDFVQTERLLQVIAALVPEELWTRNQEFNKVYTYSMKAKCLREFQDIYKQAKDKSSVNHESAKKLYEFYLDIAAQGYELYSLWKTHQGFRGTRIRCIEREGSTVIEVPDGIVFPILASLAAFAKKSNKGWRINVPDNFSDEELIKAAIAVYKDIADSNPNVMGKNKACYSALYQITSIYRRLSR